MLALVGVLASAAMAPAASTKNRYSVVKGCYSLRSVALGKLVAKDPAGGYAATAGRGAAERFRLQATDLGTYLLYGRARDFLAADGSGTETAAEPSTAAEWRLTGNGRRGFVLRSLADNRVLSVARNGGALTVGGGSGRAEPLPLRQGRRLPALPGGGDQRGRALAARQDLLRERARAGRRPHAHDGLRVPRRRRPLRSPLAPLRRPLRAASTASTTRPATAAGRCSRTCSSAARPAATTRSAGRPSATGPHHQSLTHEQSYYRWVERAWRGGLRVFVNLFVENHALCSLYPIKHNSCNEMDSVRLQAMRHLRELQDYIDAQAGGPGKGFFRIVKNPFQARRVINRGKLAVVLGIEVSQPFDCTVPKQRPAAVTAPTDRAPPRRGLPARRPRHGADQQVRQRAGRGRRRQRRPAPRSTAPTSMRPGASGTSRPARGSPRPPRPRARQRGQRASRRQRHASQGACPAPPARRRSTRRSRTATPGR